MSYSNEIWKDIEGYEGMYQVSNLGRVKSLKISDKTLNGNVGKNGYAYVHIRAKHTDKRFTIHRLVAIAFIPNPENKPQVNHISGIKTDNRVENLEWVTISENHKHAFRTGLKTPTNLGKFGKDNTRAIAICQYGLKGNLIEEYGSAVDAHNTTGIRCDSICKCLKGVTMTSGGFIWKYKN